MAEKVKFQPQTFDINSINGGNRYGLEGIQPEAVNAPIEAAAYAQALATNQPNIENINGDGTPSVSIEEFDGTPRFKFQNLKGEKGIDGKDHSEEIAQLNEKLETYFISAKEQIDINSEEISKNSAKIHNLTGALLEGGVMGVVKVSQAFTTRQTADGENIIDNQNTFPKKIAGSTQNCYSLVDFSSAASANGLTVTANNNTLTISGTPTASYRAIFSADISDLLKDGKTYTLYQSVPYSSAAASGAVYMQVNLFARDGTINSHVYSANSSGKVSFVCDKTTSPKYTVHIMNGTALDTINSTISFMLYEGTDEKPYQPYFKGLKNAYFEKVVSTGRSLIDFSTAKKSIGGLTVTADNNTLTISGTPTYNNVVLYREDITDLLEDGGSYSLCQSEIQKRVYHQLVRTNIRTGEKRYANSATTGYFTFVVDKSTYTYTIEIVTSTVENSGTFDNFECSFMFYKGTEALPYEPYTESELGFSSSPDLAIVEEVADDNLIYLSDMSNISVGMLIDFYYEDGTIISGATSREVLSVDIEEKSIVIDGADPMENVPVYTTVRRSAQVKLPEWDYILPQEQKIVRQTKRIVLTDGSNVYGPIKNDNFPAGYRYIINLGDDYLTFGDDSSLVRCNTYFTPTDNRSWRTMEDGDIVAGISGTDRRSIFIRDDRYTTINDFRAYLAEQYAAGDPVIVEYKLAEATEEDIVVGDNYTAYQGGLEKVVQGNTDNSEYGAMCTLTNDYFVKVGGATNEQTE